MTIEDIKYFKTPEGEELIQKYKDLSKEELEMLAFSLVKKNTPHYPYLITLLKLRKKAEAKFSLASEMFFDSLTLEMATSEKIADHIALRYKEMKKVTDLSCGIGANAIAIAKYSKVKAVDLNELAIQMAKYNAEVYAVEKNIDFVVGNAHFNIDKNTNAFFLDPMRSREGKTKTRSILNSEPQILEIIPKIFSITKNLCIKISPAFDYKELSLLSEEPEIEIISENNENKVALFWFGDLKKNSKKATIFKDSKKIEFFNSKDKDIIDILDSPLKYIFEPDLAIIKSHLIDEIAIKYNLSKLNKNIAFLTKNSFQEEEKRLFRIFKVIEYGEFSLKNIKKSLSRLESETISIINRGTPLNNEKIIKDLKLKEGKGLFLLITKLKNEKNHYIIAERV